jgi:phage terminase large subunit-like protein
MCTTNSKICTKCGEDKPLESFHRQRSGKHGRLATCKVCEIERSRSRHYKKTYSISVKEYDDMVEKQQGACAICGTHQDDPPKRLYVDHDHETGAVRGLLCMHCNAGLGHFRDSQGLMLRAIKYLD